MESRITDAAYKAEDVMEEIAALQEVFEEIHFLSVEVMKIRNKQLAEAETLPPEFQFPNDSLRLSSIGLDETETAVVGLDDDFIAVKDSLYGHSSDFQVIPIIGMGGIGKSTLARKLFDEACQGKHFDRCAWIVVSQQYSRRDLLLGLLQSFTKEAGKQDTKSESELEVCIHKEQIGRRCLIVVDDLWNTQAWDGLNRLFPKGLNGSRVLVTTRLLDVATYVASSCSSPHQMHLLSEYHCWRLLQERVFGKGSCPSELEEIGKKIANKCHGLPLTVVVVAGLLKGDYREEYWTTVLENISTSQPSIAEQCSRVVSLSFDHLPLHLKPCFLYSTAFPEDAEINANRLIRLSVAERFVEPSDSRCLEEIAEGYLDDLAGRSLVLISRRRYNGRIKAVRVHDLLRDFGILKSQEQSFNVQLSTSKSHGDRSCHGTFKRNPIRLTVRHTVSLNHLLEIDLLMTRSVLIFLEGLSYEKPTCISDCPSLRVFEAPHKRVELDLNKSLHLRYLAYFTYNLNIPKSLLKLRNVYSLILKGFFKIPVEIFKMPSLRHVISPDGVYLVYKGSSFEQSDFKPMNLQTLLLIYNWEGITRETTEMLVNLRKLGLSFDSSKEFGRCRVKDIVHLNKLEALKLQFHQGESNGSRLLQLLVFPPSLKRLTLINTCCRWEDMSVVGSLPNLESLKLRPIEGQFEKLKYMELCEIPLQHWEADSCHFPSLEILVIKYMYLLDLSGNEEHLCVEIPSGIGEIDSLKLIEVHHCGKLLEDSAKQLLANQREIGNDDLQVIISG